jgi:hypothetical protein
MSTETIFLKRLHPDTVIEMRGADGVLIKVEIVGPVTSLRYGQCMAVRVLNSPVAFVHPDNVTMQVASLELLGDKRPLPVDFNLTAVPDIQAGRHVMFDDTRVVVHIQVAEVRVVRS